MSLPASLRDRLRLPAVGAPLFIISNPDLVLAQCKAGIVGSFPALNARPPELLDEWLARITEDLGAYNRAHPDRPAAPFAVNQIVHKSNDRLEHDLAVVRQIQGADRHHLARRAARRSTTPCIPMAASCCTTSSTTVRAQGDREGRRRPDRGRRRRRRPCRHASSPFALVQEIRQWFDGPLLLSGAIANGAAILAAQAMGADLAYIGSRIHRHARGQRRRRPTSR